MNLNKNITSKISADIFYQVWVLITVITVFLNSVGAIRVYEGTNFPDAPQRLYKNSGLTKKSLLISKRSWNPIDEALKSSKRDKKFDGKWKELNKRTAPIAGAQDTPSLYKIKFSEKRNMQYLKYITDIPRLKEYTFCLWYFPTNLTRDQTLFSYALNKNERLLKFWISSVDSTIRMAIRENLVYQVPVNIREYKWYHICQSWNGVLGEWQVFLDGKITGSGVLSHYKGTYIPEGGEITLGPDLYSVVKGNNEGLNGEIFGFNVVDESVPHNQALFINFQYKPKVMPQVVPPFKKLPPIKKTYQEIKAYLSTLPGDSPETPKGSESAPYPGEERNVIKKPKDTYHVPSKRNRGSQRHRYPPMRKVVVYSRDDRQLSENEGYVEINKTITPKRTKVTSVEPLKNETVTLKPKAKKPSQLFDENYSIHSYRLGKDDRKSSNYEIYEPLEDDPEELPEDDRLNTEESIEKKAQGNFNLFTAREANKVYTLSSSVKDVKKPKFHFETMVDFTEPEKSNRRSFTVEENKYKDGARPSKENNEKEDKVSDSIPVYESEPILSRQKRVAETERNSKQLPTDDSLTDSNGFRRLPQIPDSFISIFTKNASKTEIEQQLSQFFPNSTSTESNILLKLTELPKSYVSATETPKFFPVVTEDEDFEQEPTTERIRTTKWIPEDFQPALANIVKTPIGGKIPQIKDSLYQTVLSETTPAKFALPSEEIQDLDPRQPFEIEDIFQKNIKQPLILDADKRKFDVSLGADLVMRSYGLCTADRGSPIHEKDRLIISWSDTPVRIFGGAQVEIARNECGNF